MKIDDYFDMTRFDDIHYNFIQFDQIILMLKYL